MAGFPHPRNVRVLEVANAAVDELQQSPMRNRLAWIPCPLGEFTLVVEEIGEAGPLDPADGPGKTSLYDFL